MLRDIFKNPRSPQSGAARSLTWGIGVLCGMLGIVSSFAQVEVDTLGGGANQFNLDHFGHFDGNLTKVSQFNRPMGLAFDLQGFLFVADSENQAVRQVDLAGDLVSTYISEGLELPVDLMFDPVNNLYVVDETAGKVLKFDLFGNQTAVWSGLTQPTAIALTPSSNLVVTEFGGTLFLFENGTGDFSVADGTILAEGLVEPRGLAVLEDGLIVVSESGRHVLSTVDPDKPGVITIYAGQDGVSGFRDGFAADALFDHPHDLARAGNGVLVVADRMNHRVRLVNSFPIVSTLYGIDKELWGPQFPGWFDGNVTIAEAREPVGVVVSPTGSVIATESHYHLLRDVSNSGLTPPPGSGNPDIQIDVAEPRMIPNFGYFPSGKDVVVVDGNTNVFLSSRIFYTVDGSDPTTNSFEVNLTNKVGVIKWIQPDLDLTSLSLKAFIQDNSSETVTGIQAIQNEIGITESLTVGMGSKIILPIVVNLKPESQLRSLQFLVEVEPLGNAPAIPNPFTALPISDNDFVRIKAASFDRPVLIPQTAGLVKQLAVAYIGTNSMFSVDNFAVVTMLSIPISPLAKPEDKYTIRIVNPTGTSDGQQAPVSLVPMAPQTIQVSELGFLVGDSSPGTWYNTGGFGFGEGSLANDDVNSAFFASLGVFLPYNGTDVFIAMDSFPSDTEFAVGGDGAIRFLDWQLSLARSLQLDPNRWTRTWRSSGLLEPELVGTTGAPPAVRVASRQDFTLDFGWYRPAKIEAKTIENTDPGELISVPVILDLMRGHHLSGMSFRAIVNSQGNAPSIRSGLRFRPQKGFAAPMLSQELGLNQVLCAWPLGQMEIFTPGPIQIGTLEFVIPLTAEVGDSYSISFPSADGSPDASTQFDFETLKGQVWVRSSALKPQRRTSDEWIQNFFNGMDSAITNDDSDPDQDKVDNIDEYLAGTDPQDASSHLKLETPEWLKAEEGGNIILKWQTVAGRFYSLESITDPAKGNWSSVGDEFQGNGREVEYRHEFQRGDGSVMYYRIRLLN